MIGRQMMGRIDSRLRQGKAGHSGADDNLGGLSCACVGDPAQCEAIRDQQIYDCTPHRDTSEGTAASKLSNKGLEIYAEFDDVVILTTCHRIRQIEGTSLSDDEIAYNERAARYLQLLHRLRDLTWTLEDYYWLCKRKSSMLTFQERLRFRDAPVIMDF